MGLITRANKAGSGTRDWANGALLPSSELNKDFNDLFDLVNGNLDTNNLIAAAGIKGAQLADSPNGITTAKVNDSQITAIKLAKDTSIPGQDTNRAVSQSHIQAIDAVNLDRIIAASSGTPKTGGINLDKLSVTKYQHTTGLSGIGGPTNIVVSPTTDFLLTDYELIGLYLDQIVSSVSPDLPGVYAKTDTTKWQFVVCYPGSGSYTSRVNAIFIKKIK